MIEGSEETVQAWRERYRTLSRDAFVRQFPHPFLVVSRTVSRVQAGATAEPPTSPTGPTRDMPFRTAARPSPTISDFAALLGMSATSRVAPLVKSLDNPFLTRISVGRTLNCDIVLRSSSISKLHAYFQNVTADEAELVDSKSANGTTVNGLRIPPQEPFRIVTGAKITFGSIPLQFASAPRFFDLL